MKKKSIDDDDFLEQEDATPSNANTTKRTRKTTPVEVRQKKL